MGKEKIPAVPAIHVSSLDLLGIMFVGFKLAGLITWPWYLVVAPFYAFILLFVLIFIAAFTVECIGKVFQ